MKRAIDIAKLMALLLLAAALFALTFWILQLRQNIDDLTNHYIAVAKQAVVDEQDLDDTINDLHKSTPLVPKLINDARLTLDNANKAAIDERMYFEQEMPGLMAQVNATLDQAHGTLAAYQTTGESLTAAANGLLPVETNAALTLKDADSVIANPRIPKLLTHADDATAATAATMQHLSATSGDVQVAVHNYLHPSWAARLTGFFTTAAHAAVNWFGF